MGLGEWLIIINSVVLWVSFSQRISAVFIDRLNNLYVASYETINRREHREVTENHRETKLLIMKYFFLFISFTAFFLIVR